jgi:hypothetical protein
MDEYEIIEHSYPTSLSGRNNQLLARLQLLYCDVLLNCVQKFRDSTCSRAVRTKAGYIHGLIDGDFTRHTNILVQVSTPELIKWVLPAPHHSTHRFALICQFVHKRFGPFVASRLLPFQSRWHPPEVRTQRCLSSCVDPNATQPTQIASHQT